MSSNEGADALAGLLGVATSTVSAVLDADAGISNESLAKALKVPEDTVSRIRNVEADVSNERLAELLGVSAATVSRVRNGSRHPGPDLMKGIQQLFRWPVGEQYELKTGADPNAYRREFNRRYFLWAAKETERVSRITRRH